MMHNKNINVVKQINPLVNTKDDQTKKNRIIILNPLAKSVDKVPINPYKDFILYENQNKGRIKLNPLKQSIKQTFETRQRSLSKKDTKVFQLTPMRELEGRLNINNLYKNYKINKARLDNH